MKYDDASWHSGGSFPAGSPPEFGGTHIALFLRWCFTKGWIGELHRTGEPEDTRRMIEGKMSATEYLFKYCDGQLNAEDLNEAGNAFAAQYYGENGLFLDEYAAQFDGMVYVAPEAAHDFSKFSAMCEARLKNGILTKDRK